MTPAPLVPMSPTRLGPYARSMHLRHGDSPVRVWFLIRWALALDDPLTLPVGRMALVHQTW